MITQKQLREVVTARRRLAALEKDPRVLEYLEAGKTVEGLLKALTVRVVSETVETGALALVKLFTSGSPCVSWEKVLNLLLAIPGVKRAVDAEPAAVKLLASVKAKTGAFMVPRGGNLKGVDVVKAPKD